MTSSHRGILMECLTKFVKNERRRRVVTIVIICRCPFRWSRHLRITIRKPNSCCSNNNEQHAVPAQVKIRLLLFLFIYQFEMHSLFSSLRQICIVEQLNYYSVFKCYPLHWLILLIWQSEKPFISAYFFHLFRLFVCLPQFNHCDRSRCIPICSWCIQQICDLCTQ